MLIEVLNTQFVNSEIIKDERTFFSKLLAAIWRGEWASHLPGCAVTLRLLIMSEQPVIAGDWLRSPLGVSWVVVGVEDQPKSVVHPVTNAQVLQQSVLIKNTDLEFFAYDQFTGAKYWVIGNVSPKQL